MARTVGSAPLLACTAVVFSLSLGLGCNASDGTGNVFPSGGAGGSGGSSGSVGGGGTGGEGGVLIPPDDGGGIPDPVGPAEVFGHSASTLYKLNPDTKEVTVVAQFSGCSSVIDIALDADSNIIGTTF